MKNNLSLFLVSRLKLKVSGKRADNFIHKLASMHIELLHVSKTKKGTIYIWIYKRDYPIVYKLKSIYDVEVVDAKGYIKLKKVILVNRYLIFSIIIGLITLFLLTNIVFKIDVISSNKDTRDFIMYELKKYGIEKCRFKKSFKELNDIKESILLEYKDRIEWIEIEEVGVKYVIRLQLREIMDNKETVPNRNLVAAKDATIKKIIAYDGQIVKTINSYVKKGDIIVSGIITLNDNTKGFTSANGRVFGEVWYNMTVEYPFTYYEEKYTGKSNNALVFKFINWKINIPFNNNYKTQNEVIIFNNRLLPLKLSYETQRKIQIIDQVLTEEETIAHATLLAKDKMKGQLGEQEYIISQKNLKINIKDSKIVLEVFFVVYEDITDYQEIKEEITTE